MSPHEQSPPPHRRFQQAFRRINVSDVWSGLRADARGDLVHTDSPDHRRDATTRAVAQADGAP